MKYTCYSLLSAERFASNRPESLSPVVERRPKGLKKSLLHARAKLRTAIFHRFALIPRRGRWTCGLARGSAPRGFGAVAARRFTAPVGRWKSFAPEGVVANEETGLDFSSDVTGVLVDRTFKLRKAVSVWRCPPRIQTVIPGAALAQLLSCR